MRRRMAGVSGDAAPVMAVGLMKAKREERRRRIVASSLKSGAAVARGGLAVSANVICNHMLIEIMPVKYLPALMLGESNITSVIIIITL